MLRNGVYVCKMTALAAVAAVLVLATTPGAVWAQDQDPYAIGYFSNAHTSGAPDGTLRVVNDGTLSDHSPDGDLCASIYVFDNTEELMECCSCKVTPNGLLTLSVNTNLTNNTLTSVVPKRGVIKVVSSNPKGSSCDPTNDSPQTGIRSWLTHVEKNNSSWAPSMEELIDASFSSSEEADLTEDCKVLIELGSGRGICSCTDAKW